MTELVRPAFCGNCQSYHDGPCHFDPTFSCIFCDEPVGSLSLGGSAICPYCDCGHHRDGRQWTAEESAAFHENAKKRTER